MFTLKTQVKSETWPILRTQPRITFLAQKIIQSNLTQFCLFCLKVQNSSKEFVFDVQEVNDGFRFLAMRTNQKIPFMMALDLFERKDPEFLESFLEVLKKKETFKAYYFETPPMNEIKVS